LEVPLVTFNEIREFQNRWSSHANLCGQISQSGPDQTTRRRSDEDSSYCQMNDQRSGWWAEGFGYNGNQGARDVFGAYDSTILGAMVGYDELIADNTRAGLGIGYARSSVSASTFDAGTNFNTYQGTAYVAHDDGRWFADGDVSVGLNQYSGTELISVNGVNTNVNSSYLGDDVTGYVSGGYHFFDHGFTITPLASLQGTFIHINGYTQTGAGSLDLAVDSQDYTFLESGLGVKLGHPFAFRDGTDIFPELHLKWFHDLINPTIENTSAFAVAGSPVVTTAGLQIAADTFNIGAGLALVSAGPWSVDAVYDDYWRSDSYFAQSVKLEFSARF
jgi:outer membrane autotransporter protein